MRMHREKKGTNEENDKKNRDMHTITYSSGSKTAAKP